jgi:hypothetical protein
LTHHSGCGHDEEGEEEEEEELQLTHEIDAKPHNSG